MGSRPDALQWAAMGVTVLGAVLVARSAGGFAASGGYTSEHLRRTIVIAGAASVVYAVLVVAGQAAVPIYGELQTLWLGRWVGIATVLAVFAAQRRAPGLPLRWWPLIGLQSLLDATGYLALFAGSRGEGSEIAAVAASAFGAITTVLARIFLREMMGPVQWIGVAFVFFGVAVLSAAG
jgi:drug/metabolite transporter (DMT)-like permease